MNLMCQGCKLTPNEIAEYVDAAREEGISPEAYAWENEGTLNRENGHFLCTDCYITAEMPGSPTGWVCP